jgi:LytS/YehU family sensor histidine kinase
MRPTRTQLALGIAWMLFWLLGILTAIQDYLRDGGDKLWQPVLWEGSSGIVATVLLLLQRRFTRRYDYLLPSPRSWFLRQLPWLGVYWVAFTPVTFGIRHGVYALMQDHYTHAPWPQTVLYEDIKITVFFCIFVTITFGVLTFQALMEEKLRAERANTLLRQNQLLRLTQQMQPHFLFNALNTISSLMHTDVERADAMLIQLADVLRSTLDAGDRHLVPLETELRLLRGYALLMSERFEDRVRIEWRIDASLLACQVPVMSMQPLLENIFKHTVERRRAATGITITAARSEQDAGMLVLRLEDDAGELAAATPAGMTMLRDGGDAGGEGRPALGRRGGSGSGSGSGSGVDDGNGRGGSDKAGSGIGTGNLRERLAALYGDGASFALTQLQPAGVRAEICLPCAS